MVEGMFTAGIFGDIYVLDAALTSTTTDVRGEPSFTSRDNTYNTRLISTFVSVAYLD